MMKISLVFAVLFVSTYARGLPFGFHHGNSPQRLDTPDDQDVAAAAAAGQAGQAQTGGQVNEVGDTPDDQDEAFAAAAGQGAAAQGATTIAPLSPGDGGDSSSSSSEEGSDAPDASPGPSPGPLPGAGGQEVDTDNLDDGAVINAQGAPIFDNAVEQTAGDSSGNHVNVAPNAAPGGPSPLKVHQEHAESQGRKSGALIAITTLGLVAMVAATSFVAYKYKDAISARLGM